MNLGLLGLLQVRRASCSRTSSGSAWPASGIDVPAADPDIILPVGISFYTFQTLSYTIDVYRGEIEPGAVVPRLRPVRDLLPAARRRADRARPANSCPSASRRSGPTRGRSAGALSLLALGPLPEGRPGRRPARADRRSRSSARRRAAGLLDAWIGTLRLLRPDLLRLRGLLAHARSARRCVWASRCPRTSAAPTRRAGSPTSGGAGTSRCRAGCATTSTSRSAATGAATPEPTST